MDDIVLGSLDEFTDGDHRVFAVAGIEIGVFRRGQELIAFENRCPHYAGPVCQGRVFRRVREDLQPDQTSKGLSFAEEEHIVCPWHGLEFNIRTGRHPGHARMRLRRLDVRLVDGRVTLRLPAGGAAA